MLEKSEANSIDTTLSFLDDHISRCLESGETPYIPIHLRQQPTGKMGYTTNVFP